MKKEKEKEKMKNNNLVLKGCSSSSVNKKKKKNLAKRRVRCPVPVFDSNYFFPCEVTTFEYDGTRDLEFPKEKYLEDTKPLKLVKGERIEEDVYGLLSNSGKRDYLVRNNGDRVGLIDAITGKYLLICCFFVPMHIDCCGIDECRAMITAYSKLKAAGKDIEMVMVAKMRTAFIAEFEEEPAFNYFFSAFPCLALPSPSRIPRLVTCFASFLDWTPNITILLMSFSIQIIEYCRRMVIVLKNLEQLLSLSPTTTSASLIGKKRSSRRGWILFTRQVDMGSCLMSRANLFPWKNSCSASPIRSSRNVMVVAKR